MAAFAANPLLNTDFLLAVGLLAVVLLAGAVVLYATDAWRKRRDARADDSPLTLQHYRELFEAGELTEPEYAKVRDRLAGRLANRPPSTDPRTDASP